MRTPSYSVHQGLTPDATAIVKTAITLARRRGHAQVTPLHVATAMMGASTGLLRSACLRAHSHPLQCKALELCFNVALNRLPTSIILGPSTHHHHPSFSNALIAAFKRAQAHQRRGSVENQQQPILALKIEHEQLVISILDDPSVSRVMREAGFSSPHVKKNVEQSVSLEISSSSSHNQNQNQNHSLVKTEPKETIKPVFQLTLNKSNDYYVNSVLDSLKQRNNTVIVAENLEDAESIMRGVMGKLDRGDERFVSVPLSFRNMSIEDVQQRIGELRCLVNGYESKWVVLYLGDLKWVSEFWSNYGELRRNHYSPVELMIMEISRLLRGVGEKGNKLSLMGIADLQTYMRCKIGHPSLETLWQLHPLTVPIGSLGLSLNLDSELQRKVALGNEHSSWLMKTGVEKNLNCCSDCTANYKREAWSIEMSTNSTFSSLPSWLQSYKEDQNKRKTISDQDFDKLKDLCKKWNSICRSVHKQPHFLESAIILSSSSPSSSSSVSSHDKNKKRLLHQKPELLSNPNSSPNSASCSEANDDEDEDKTTDQDGYAHSFKDFNSENLKALSKGIEKKVPWHKDIIPDISSTVLECRSGMVVRRSHHQGSNFKEETWLSFLGVDQNGKEKIGKELARIVFGSYNNFVAIGGYSDDSMNEEYCMIKNAGSSYLDRFVEAVKENPSRVFFMEDVDKVDHISQMGIKKAIESGRIISSSHVSDGEFVPLKDAIVIFSCDSFSSMSRPCSPPTGEIQAINDNGFCGPLDLNIGATENENEDDYSVSRIGGIMDIIDRQIIFKIQVL